MSKEYHEFTLDDWEEYYKDDSSTRERVEAFFAFVFKNYPELQYANYRGYTPSWNDGEPCEHWGEASLGPYLSEMTFPEACYYEPGDDDYEPIDYYEDRVDWEFVCSLPCTKYETIWRIVQAVETEICTLHGTNYDIWIFPKEGGGVEMIEESYHCGY